MKVDLPSGAVVELRERVTNRDRKRYVAAMENGPREEIALIVPVVDLTTGEPAVGDDGEIITETRVVKQPTWLGSMEVSNTILALLVESWTLDLPTPRDATDDVLDELEIADYDALATAAQPIVQKLFVNANPGPDTDSPSTPSNE